MAKNLSFLSIILIICGCTPSKQAIVSDSLDAIPEISGSVINPTAFEKGGTLVLGVFKPGPGAVADDVTDQLSLMMVKGINDTLPLDNTHFTVQSSEQKNSDYLLDGFIEDFEIKGHFAQLSVDGGIDLRENSEKIFMFKTSIMVDLKSEDPSAAAYQIGEAIAHFIGSKS